jgi:hypothetical protein
MSDTPGDPPQEPVGDPLPPGMVLHKQPEVSQPVMSRDDEIKRLEREIESLRSQVYCWKMIVSWLARCHAHTLKRLPNYTPKNIRRRITTICKQFILSSEGMFQPPKMTSGEEEEITHAVAECHEAVEKCGLQDKPPEE